MGILYTRLLARLKDNGRDFALFGISLLLAFSIWLIQNLSLNYSQEISVPVIAESSIEGHAQVSSNSVSISARCRLSGFHLMRMSLSRRMPPKHIVFDASDFQHLDDNDFVISANALSGYIKELYGDEVQLESFMSSRFQFRFPVENHKKVPVQAIAVLGFKPQYMSMGGGIQVTPDSVLVYGEPSVIEAVDRVLTRTISQKNISSSLHGTVQLEPQTGVRISASHVHYALDVTRYVEVVKELKIEPRNVPAGKNLAILPSSATAVFRCVFPLSSDPTDNIRLYVDYADFAKSINGHCIPKVSSMPSSIIDYALDPQIVECVESSR